MRLLPGAFAAALLMGAPAAWATSAPPPSRESMQSRDAIDALDPFLGAWEGEEVYKFRDETVRTRVYRQVIRPSRSDFLLITDYRGDEPNFSSLGVLTFSPGDGHYRIMLPGARLLTNEPRTDLTVEIAHPDAATLIWEEPGYEGGRVRKTATVTGDTWIEVHENFNVDGSLFIRTEVRLTRVAVRRWVVPEELTK